jgi:hypothetical protein
MVRASPALRALYERKQHKRHSAGRAKLKTKAQRQRH